MQIVLMSKIKKLFREYCNFIKKFQAAVFFLKNENVKGVLKSPFFKDMAVSNA